MVGKSLKLGLILLFMLVILPFTFSNPVKADGFTNNAWGDWEKGSYDYDARDYFMVYYGNGSTPIKYWYVRNVVLNIHDSAGWSWLEKKDGKIIYHRIYGAMAIEEIAGRTINEMKKLYNIK
jgi:hypothetical protein